MNYQDLVKQLTPELYRTFRRALELGRWPDGREMTAEQREHCLAAVIAYDQIHTPEAKRVGYIDRDAKHRASQRRGADRLAGAEEALRWTDRDENT